MTRKRANPVLDCAPRKRASAEAELQRAVVELLRLALPPGGIVHHSANEVRGGGPDAHTRQAIAHGMGVHPGFADLLVLSRGRVVFLELKSARGRLSAAQVQFRDTVLAQGHGWALVRTPDDALDALEAHGLQHRITRERVRFVPPGGGW